MKHKRKYAFNYSLKGNYTKIRLKPSRGIAKTVQALHELWHIWTSESPRINVDKDYEYIKKSI